MAVAKPIFKETRLPRKHCLDVNDMRDRQTVFMTAPLKLWVIIRVNATIDFSQDCKIIG